MEMKTLPLLTLEKPTNVKMVLFVKVNIPLAQFMSRINELPKDKPVVLYCNSGKRSRSLKYMIEKLHSFNNLTHLEGGFQKWQEEVATL